MREPLASCLCVTEDRPAFMPWLLWCFDRQTWPHRELVIVDSSPEPMQIEGRANVQVVVAPPDTSVARKRNLALQKARGEIITWFDDDDWQHPDKLAWLAEALEDGAPYAGSDRGWFVDLATLRCTPYRGPKGQVVFNSAGFRRETILPLRFQENVRKASDTRWMQTLAERFRGQAVVLDRQAMFFWLCHDTNLSNPAQRRRFPQRLDDLKQLVGDEAWDSTDEALEALRRRLQHTEQGKMDQENKKTNAASKAPASRARIVADLDPLKPTAKAEQQVGVMVKATVMDAPYLDVMVRHMISQARYPFAERIIVVDRQPALTGKYHRRPRASQEELDRVLAQLLKDGIVDQVCEVDMARPTVKRVMARYFSQNGNRVPTHAVTGGPIYATLFGLETMTADYVLQMDADVFFYANSTSWVRQALDCMTQDPQLWLMMTHPGPPGGPPGKSLGERNRSRATWDRALGIWRFRHATTRYFLCDRRQLRGRLRPVFRVGGCAPLEQCLSVALQRNQAFRGNLGDLESWHLHAWYHDVPFPQWVASLARAIEAGHYPRCQQGRYDLRLDRAADRQAWETLLADNGKKRTVQGKPMPGRARAVLPFDEASVDDEDKVAPLAVVIPIRNRASQRVRNSLRSLGWQSAGRPAQVLVVSHGSQSKINNELAELCHQEAASLVTIGTPNEPWNKSLALNTGIRAVLPDTPFVMTMDADMILAPDFFDQVLDRLWQEPPALVLCRISDLPQQASVPETTEELLAGFERLRATTRLRKRSGSGGIQAASRLFFYEIRGYDEDLLWWGAMDGDILNRARLMGLELAWIEDQTAMLHQWHPRKHRILTHPHEIDQARRHWRRNHEIVRSRSTIIQRNPNGWGGWAG